MRFLPALMVALLTVSLPAAAQDSTRTFFPENAVRGFLDVQFAPPHNEVDLGLCSTLVIPSSSCGAFARFSWGGYVEIQPFGGDYLRRFFLFADPKMYGGDNFPGLRYTASAAPILWERTAGIGIELPKNFELRLTHHDVQIFGKYTGPNKVNSLSANGPYGLYTTVGVRWYFGKYGRADLHHY